MRLHKWVPSLVGIALVLIAGAAMLTYTIEFPQADETRKFTVFLFSVVILILAGGASSFLAWRMGFRRGERLAAGISPLAVILCLIVYETVVYSHGTSHEPAYKLVDGLVASIWKPAVYILIGTAPFLFPRQRALGHRLVSD